MLRDALDRDQLFDRLWGGLHKPWQARLVPSEVDDLWRNYIPFFSARPGSHDLWDAAGRHFPVLFPGRQRQHETQIAKG